MPIYPFQILPEDPPRMYLFPFFHPSMPLFDDDKSRVVIFSLHFTKQCRLTLTPRSLMIPRPNDYLLLYCLHLYFILLLFDHTRKRVILLRLYMPFLLTTMSPIRLRQSHLHMILIIIKSILPIA